MELRYYIYVDRPVHKVYERIEEQPYNGFKTDKTAMNWLESMKGNIHYNSWDVFIIHRIMKFE